MGDVCLRVFYDSQQEHHQYRDQEARELAGCRISGAGVNLKTWVRDLEFEFQDETDLNEAQSRLREAGFRFVP